MESDLQAQDLESQRSLLKEDKNWEDLVKDFDAKAKPKDKDIWDIDGLNNTDRIEELADAQLSERSQ